MGAKERDSLSNDPDEEGLRVFGQVLDHMGRNLVQIQLRRFGNGRAPRSTLEARNEYSVDVGVIDDGTEHFGHLGRRNVLRFPTEGVAQTIGEVTEAVGIFAQ